MSLSDYSNEELLAELRRRLRGKDTPVVDRGNRIGVCMCGTKRKEYVDIVDGFLPRTGCVTCDLWDGPAILDRQTR